MKYKVTITTGNGSSRQTREVLNIEAPNSDEAMYEGLRVANRKYEYADVWVQEIEEVKYYEYRCGISSTTSNGRFVFQKESWIHVVTPSPSEEDRVASYIKSCFVGKTIDGVEYGQIMDDPFLFKSHKEKPEDTSLIFMV